MKKSSLFRSLFGLLIGASLGVACSSDPVVPVDERKNKDHGDPATVILTLRHGTLTGDRFVASAAPSSAGANASVQVVTYKLRPGVGWGPAEGSADRFSVLTEGSGAHAYELRIRYLDLRGDDITYQFVTNGQDKIHQHFFIPQNVKNAQGVAQNSEDKSAKVFSYSYLDTDPWDKEAGTSGVRLIGKDNPIGMKGVFRFKSERDFDMTIRLMHARQSKFRADGKCSPYYRPTPGQLLSDSWDIMMQLPVVARAAQ